MATTMNFIVLLLVRGTTPLMIFFGMHYLHSASLIVTLKCEISLVLFTLSAICLLRDPPTKAIILRNLQQKSTYWKLFIFGFLHSALPYFLIAHSVQHVPITLVTAFIVATPWMISILERCCTSRPNARNRAVHKVGMVVGIVGIMVMVIATMSETMRCLSDEKAAQNETVIKNNTTTNVTNGSDVSVYSVYEDTGVPFFNGTSVHCPSEHDVMIGIVCLAFAPLSWALGAVFWKRHQSDIHHVVSNIGRNAFGGIISLFAFILFGIVYDFGPINWGATQWMIYVGYLGVASGWLGTLLVQNVFSRVGPKVTNQVLTGMPLLAFAQDCMFVRHPFSQLHFPETFAGELIGILLVTIGVFASNIPEKEPDDAFTYMDMQGSITERLLSRSLDFSYPGHDNNMEDDEEPMRELLMNEQLQYEGTEGGYDTDNYTDDVSMDREVLVPLDTDDLRYLMEAPAPLAPLAKLENDNFE